MVGRQATVVAILGVILVACSASAEPAPPDPVGVATPDPTSSPAKVGPTPTTLLATPELTPKVFTRPVPTAQPKPPVDLETGVWARSIVTTLRVRSEPSTADASIKYEPLLPKGTRFGVLGAPVEGSGYWWYEVELAPGVLEGGITRGWVPAGDHDGTPWVENMGID
jgi:hypothetical protein